LNQIFVIEPYRQSGTWVFDDEARGLVQEPFVSNIPKMIDQLVGEGVARFTMNFSDQEFPGGINHLKWVRAEMNGNWYTDGDGEGWLCPALLKYFPEAPSDLYVSITNMRVK